MTTWLRDETTPYDIFRFLRDPDEERHQTARVTEEGAAWLVSATARPDDTLARWQEHPGAAAALPCGGAFDVVNVEPMFGRRMLDRLWAEGPGSGPVAVHRGRMLLFAAPGTAQRLPSLLDWEEWGEAVPRPLCHGVGDAVTVPPLAPAGPDAQAPRWVVAPDTRRPWLPGPEVLLWACVRAVRMVARADVRVSIFASAEPDANVYDVSRRR
ncbi:bifunctional DNA primase/polymerase [Streptomyces roseicoloratus]|uniref:Bifunctional DNA primase/polymerase n=1 Tax=Streptomyces roseicoloratus TaxID=2508722 RepID=A0ABY9RXG3_9ACTN|nr:bifunctional DNA primase/polymerase [Streptomyces roseicoloratus]WMX46867.1 bifunctional DNA primase/polymerase [Streptomyces roseicoloratus]